MKFIFFYEHFYKKSHNIISFFFTFSTKGSMNMCMESRKLIPVPRLFRKIKGPILCKIHFSEVERHPNQVTGFSKEKGGKFNWQRFSGCVCSSGNDLFVMSQRTLTASPSLRTTPTARCWLCPLKPSCFCPKDKANVSLAASQNPGRLQTEGSILMWFFNWMKNKTNYN